MGRGRSGSGGGSSNSATQVAVQSGNVIDLSKNPLIYGALDPAISGNVRTVVEAQEKKRLKAKTEYALLTDANGNIIDRERHGGKGSVNLPSWAVAQSSVMTHNHPRGKGEEECLGGTFSNADLNLFSGNSNMRTIRASAAEGTYSMTKGANFRAGGFYHYVAQINKNRVSEYKKASGDYKRQSKVKIANGTMTYKQYISGQSDIFNSFLVNMHNDLLAGQKKYGYSYTLERRK